MQKVEPRVEVSVRPATQDDFVWIDALQKSESDKVGFLWEQAIRKRIEQGNIIVAEAVMQTVAGGKDEVASEQGEHASASACHSSDPLTPAGYCLGVDRYMKQDHVGIIYQMCIVPRYRRSLVAATLLQAQFDKSAYGTKLYGCWCKQSLAANRFWEAMGFVPLAFRAGSRKKTAKVNGQERHVVHIYWQNRVRVGDTGDPATGGTPWWYPYETSGGAMMEGRVVLPLPPEVAWHEAVPVVLPGSERRAAEQRLLEGRVIEVQKCERAMKREAKKTSRPPTPTPGTPGTPGSLQGGRAALGAGATPGLLAGVGGILAGVGGRVVGAGGFGFGVAPGFDPESPEVKDAERAADDQARAQVELEAERLREEKSAAKKALKAAQRKNDPELVAYARELRDRWQEHVTARPAMIQDKANGRYLVGRQLPSPTQAGAGEGAGRVGVKAVEVKRLAA